MLSALEKLEPADNKYTFSANLKTNFDRIGKSTAENSYTSVEKTPLGERSKLWASHTRGLNFSRRELITINPQNEQTPY